MVLTVFKSREKGRLARFVVPLAVVGVLLAAGTAYGVSQTIIGQADNTFNAGSYTSNPGDVAQLQVTGSTHNATASALGPDGKALFRSATVSSGTTPVNGTQYLSAGTYQFICTIHTNMVANLVVGGNGTPVPRPSVALQVTSKKISKVLKQGLLVQSTASAKVDGLSLTAKLGKTTIGTATNQSIAQGAVFETIKLTNAGKSKLRKLKKASITVTGDVPFGAPATAKAKLK
jgi:plastocyanin